MFCILINLHLQLFCLHKLCICDYFSLVVVVVVVVQEPLSLCLAVQSGDVEPVKSLLVALEGGREEGGGCDTERTVDQRNEQSHAPLHLACTSGNV